MSSADGLRAAAWRTRGLPPEEKLLLLALIDAAETGEAMRSRPDLDSLPPLVEEAAWLTGLGIGGCETIARRLEIRGLIEADGKPKIKAESAA